MFYTYILESIESGRLYIGHTGKLSARIHRHLSGKVNSTRRETPWRLLHAFELDSKSEACRLEQKLKRWKNPKRVKALIQRTSHDKRVEGSKGSSRQELSG